MFNHKFLWPLLLNFTSAVFRLNKLTMSFFLDSYMLWEIGEYSIGSCGFFYEQ